MGNELKWKSKILYENRKNYINFRKKFFFLYMTINKKWN